MPASLLSFSSFFFHSHIWRIYLLDVLFLSPRLTCHFFGHLFVVSIYLRLDGFRSNNSYFMVFFDAKHAKSSHVELSFLFLVWFQQPVFFFQSDDCINYCTILMFIILSCQRGMNSGQCWRWRGGILTKQKSKKLQNSSKIRFPSFQSSFK